MKKFLALVLALTMALALSVSVLAANDGDSYTSTQKSPTDKTTISGDNGNQQSIYITTILYLPLIEVEIAVPNDIIINPYKMAYEITASETSQEQVINKAFAITNKSAIKMKVTATPTIKTNGDVEIVTAPPTANETAKKLYLKLSMANAAALADVDNFKGVAATNLTNVSDAIVVAESPATTPNTAEITLDVGKTTNTYGAMIFTGSCSGTSWADTDKIESLTVVFNIAPVIDTTTP